MKQLTCEMCGGTDLIKQDGVFVCQSCGCKYSVDEAKKMMIEGTVDISGSTVKIDNSSELNYLKEKLHRSIDIKDYNSMFRTSDEILRIDPKNPEVLFVYGYSMAANDDTAINKTIAYAREAIFLEYDIYGESKEFYSFLTTVLLKLKKLIDVCYSNYVNGTYSQSYQMNEAQMQQKLAAEYARTGEKQDVSLLNIAENAFNAKIDQHVASSNFKKAVGIEIIKLTDAIYNLKLLKFSLADDEFFMAYINILNLKNNLCLELITKESVEKDTRILEMINSEKKEVEKQKDDLLITLNNLTVKFNKKIERDIKLSEKMKKNKYSAFNTHLGAIITGLLPVGNILVLIQTLRNFMLLKKEKLNMTIDLDYYKKQSINLFVEFFVSLVSFFAIFAEFIWLIIEGG